MAAGCLLPQTMGAFLHGKRRKRLPRPQLVPLAWHLDACATRPEDVLQLFQLASLAGTTESEGLVAVMRMILQGEWAYRHPVVHLPLERARRDGQEALSHSRESNTEPGDGPTAALDDKRQFSLFVVIH